MKKSMKLFYVLLLLTCSYISNAQRTIDIETILGTPADNSTLHVGTDHFDLLFYVVNKGPDAIVPTDTLAFTFQGAHTTFVQAGYSKKAGDTIIVAMSGLIFYTAPAQDVFCVLAGLFNNHTSIDPDSTNDQDCHTVYYKDATGISNNSIVSDTRKIKIYPNPASSKVDIEYWSNKAAETILSIVDVTGKSVLLRNYGVLTKGSNNMQLDISNLNPGIYFIQLEAEGERINSKFVKQ